MVVIHDLMFNSNMLPCKIWQLNGTGEFVRPKPGEIGLCGRNEPGSAAGLGLGLSYLTFHMEVTRHMSFGWFAILIPVK